MSFWILAMALETLVRQKGSDVSLEIDAVSRDHRHGAREAAE